MTTEERNELTYLRRLYESTPIRNYTPAMREGGAKWKRHEELLHRVDPEGIRMTVEHIR